MGKKQRQRLIFLRYKRHKILNKKHNIKQPIKPNKMKIKLKDINHEVKENFILCSIVLKDGSHIKQKYIGHNLCEAKRNFLQLLKSM